MMEAIIAIIYKVYTTAMRSELAVLNIDEEE